MRHRSRDCRWPTLARGLVLAGLALAAASPVDAGVLCRTRKGTVTFRDAECRRREVPIDPAVLGLDERYYTKAEADTRFASSERVLSGSVQMVIAPVGSVLFRDAATGLEVRMGDFGRPRLVNTNSDGAPLAVRGVGWFVRNNIYGFDADIPAGDSVHVTFDAVGFGYGSFLVVKRVADGSAAPRLALTCAFRDSSIPEQVVLSCVGVR